MGQIQTETPYYQPSTNPFPPLTSLNDPTCRSSPHQHQYQHQGETCEAWGLRIVDSHHVNVYGAGLYSFYHDYSTCEYIYLSPLSSRPPPRLSCSSKNVCTRNPATLNFFKKKRRKKLTLTIHHSMLPPHQQRLLPTQPPKHRRRAHEQRQHIQPQHHRGGEHDNEGRGQSGGLQRQRGRVPGQHCRV